MAPRIVCVVGPTACGKTTLGVLLAKRYGGEVVSADSMQIYRGMTIGTAAPTAEATAEPDENAVPEYAVLNTVPAGATLTLSGTHSSGITSVCYRFDGGQTTTVQGESVEVEVPAGAQLLELYVIGGNGIASQWAAYYLTAE